MIRALLLATVATGLGFAQLLTGSIAGAVKDPSGLAMAAVSITATQAATGAVRQTASNERGDFVLTTGETLPAGDVKLELGGVSERVTVTSEGAVGMTRSSDRATRLPLDEDTQTASASFLFAAATKSMSLDKVSH